MFSKAVCCNHVKMLTMNNFPFIYRDFPLSLPRYFKVVCCRFFCMCISSFLQQQNYFYQNGFNSYVYKRSKSLPNVDTFWRFCSRKQFSFEIILVKRKPFCQDVLNLISLLYFCRSTCNYYACQGIQWRKLMKMLHNTYISNINFFVLTSYIKNPTETKLVQCERLTQFSRDLIPEPSDHEAHRIRHGRVLSVGDLELASQVRSPVEAQQLWWSVLGQGKFPSLVLVCLPRDHK